LKRGFADTIHGQIHYRTEGDGAALLMLHITPISSDEFVPVLPLLGRKYRAIAMDTLGYGDSDKPPRQYSLYEYARSVVDLLDALGIEETAIIGTHTGAGIAAEVAASFPERVTKLIVDGYPLFTEAEIELRRREVPAKLQRIEPLNYIADGSHMTNTWEQVVDGLKVPPDRLADIHTLTTAILKSGPRNMEAHVALWDYQPAERLPLIRCPTLILTSSQDEFMPRTEETRRLIPGSHVKIMPGGGLIFPFQEPAAFAEAVIEFLEDAGNDDTGV